MKTDLVLSLFYYHREKNLTKQKKSIWNVSEKTTKLLSQLKWDSPNAFSRHWMTMKYVYFDFWLELEIKPSFLKSLRSSSSFLFKNFRCILVHQSVRNFNILTSQRTQKLDRKKCIMEKKRKNGKSIFSKPLKKPQKENLNLDHQFKIAIRNKRG